MKKIPIIIAVIAILAVAAFASWYFFLRNPGVPVGKTGGNSLPFGLGDNTSPRTKNQPTQGVNNQAIGNYSTSNVSIFKISQEPVAGFVVLNKGSSTDMVRYVDRATGHIYETNLTTLVKTKVTNQTLPKIYEAYFKSDGSSVLLRSLKNDSDVAENISLTLTSTQTTGDANLYTSSSTLLRQDMDSVAVGTGNALFYTTRNASSSIVSSAFNGTGAKTLLTSPFKDWRLSSSGNSLIIYTKASARASGLAYTLNPSNGALAKILGPLAGLVVMPNSNNSRVVYSYVENGETKSFAKNLKSGVLSGIYPTIAEKCVWSAKNVDVLICAIPTDSIGSNEPDNWYRGLTHFSDSIWIFDTKVGISRVLLEPKSILGLDIDATGLQLTKNESYLVFTNKNDLSLWALKIEGF